jgi:hypothetical protein
VADLGCSAEQFELISPLRTGVRVGSRKGDSMARPAETLEIDEGKVLRDYLRLLTQDHPAEPKLRSPGHDLRTCPACGHRTAFTLDPEGTWFRCTRCGEYA